MEVFFLLGPWAHDAIKLPALPSKTTPRGREAPPEMTQPLCNGGIALPWGRPLHTQVPVCEG